MDAILIPKINCGCKMSYYEFVLVYNEGVQWYRDGMLCSDNPYYGVSKILADRFDDGYWDAEYGDKS